MNNVLKVSIAGAFALGAAGAHASIAQPSTGSSDAILFGEVVNGSNVIASYAGDTGVSINALTAGVTGTNTYLGSDANLQKLFAADAAGDTLEWSVQGGQYTGESTTPNFEKTGDAQFITTTQASSTSGLAKANTANFVHWGNLNGDVSTINTNSGGANSVEGASPASAGLFDITGPQSVAYWYSNGPATYNVAGTTTELFSVTGGGGSLSKVVYANPGSETATLTSTGLTITGGTGGGGTNPPPPPPTVPLPAAVWLLGSGLLGLAGVSRRKAKV